MFGSGPPSGLQGSWGRAGEGLVLGRDAALWAGLGGGGSGDRDGPTWRPEGWPSFLCLEGPRDKAPAAGSLFPEAAFEQAARFPSCRGGRSEAMMPVEPPASVLLGNTDLREGDCGEEGGEGESPGHGPAHRAPLGGCYGNTHKHNRNKTGTLLGNRSLSSADTTVQRREPQGAALVRKRGIPVTTSPGTHLGCQGACGAQW